MDKPTKHICTGIFGYFMAIALFGIAITGQISGVRLMSVILVTAIMGTINILSHPLIMLYYTVGILIAIALVFYGLKNKQNWLGQVSIVLGFIIWTFAGCLGFATCD
jgi:hypothetical protein